LSISRIDNAQHPLGRKYSHRIHYNDLLDIDVAVIAASAF
jgi:hypothetical protein